MTAADRYLIDLNAKPSDIENKLTVSSIARRRLAVVITRLRMAETVSDVSLHHLPAPPPKQFSHPLSSLLASFHFGEAFELTWG